MNLKRVLVGNEDIKNVCVIIIPVKIFEFPTESDDPTNALILPNYCRSSNVFDGHSSLTFTSLWQ